LAGIDFGTVRVGIAVCDPDRILASPLSTYTRRDDSADAMFFQDLVADQQIVGFVVGLPVHMSGDESRKSRQARRFGEWLERVTGLPVGFQDERFTTSEANDLMAAGGLTRQKANERRDMLAAQAILARFLESRDRNPPQSFFS
jgi:putative Holliday junction resolvase